MDKKRKWKRNQSVRFECLHSVAVVVIVFAQLETEPHKQQRDHKQRPTRAIAAVTTTTAFSLTAALVSDLVCLFQSSSYPFARMQNAFNHFICYCVLCFIHSRLHQHQHLQLCLRFVLPNSKIFYLLCTYDPHAGTAGLSPIGLSESDTSVCCCCCCLMVALSAAFPSPPRRMLCKSVLCACVCVLCFVCLPMAGYSECHCNSLPRSLHSLLTGVGCSCCDVDVCNDGLCPWPRVCVCMCVYMGSSKIIFPTLGRNC